MQSFTMHGIKPLSFSLFLLFVLNVKVFASKCGQNQASTSDGAYMIVGGKGRKDVEFLHINDDPPSGDCESFAEAPFVTQHAIGLRDSEGKPMVCGGSRNPKPKTCYVYDIVSNSWSQGPNMKRDRIGASVTCLGCGTCWVFGGKSKSVTEFYNSTTSTFETGPLMPVNSVHGLCTALAPSGLIYMAARREPGKTRSFTFDPETQTFTELPSIDVEKRYMSCAVIPGNGCEEYFHVVGGGVSEAAPTSTTHVFSSTDGTWSEGPEYISPLIGGTQMTLPSSGFFVIFGGITSTTKEQTDLSGLFFPEDGKWIEDDWAMRGPRAYGVGIHVENVCPGSDEL